jgi:chromosome partitioning protein
MTKPQTKIITVFSQKGGSGKTMVTMQLAGAFALMGLRVFVVDMDPQPISTLWSLAASKDQPFPADVMSMAALGDQFLQKLSQFVDKYDVIFIDCPPALDSTVPWVSLLAADMALIPVIPEMGNVWAAKQAEQLVQRARARRESDGSTGELKAAYALTNVRRGKVFETCEDLLRKQAEIPILDTQLNQRNAYPESVVYGCVVQSFGKSPAATELEQLANEVAASMQLALPKSEVPA